MNRQRGITLVEAIIAAALALIIGLLLVKLLSSGLGAHSKGAQSRDAQSGVRNVLALMTAELRSATPPPLASPLVVTPVFWPGVWGAEQELGTRTPFYERVEVTPDGSTEEVDQATNRVLYVRTTEDETDPADGPLAPFVLVELFVPEDRPYVIERRLHTLTGLDSLLVLNQVTGADGNRRQGWLLDVPALEGLTPAAEPDVVFDAGTNARIAFRITHRTFQPAADPGRTRYPQIFEPGVFKVEVAMAVGAKVEGDPTNSWPDKTEWSTIREEATELRIPAVRQN